MRYYILSFLILIFLSACSGQSSNLKKANEVKDAIAEARPGTIPTTTTSWTMKANIDGKSWNATSMMPPQMAGKIVGYVGVGYIAINYRESEMVVGKKIKIDEDNPVDVSLGHDADFWVGKMGEIVITKVDGGWAEGNFHFSATARTKSNQIEVTDGFFRISMK